MNPQTYEALPTDLKALMGDQIGIDESIPTGLVAERSSGKTMPVAEFISAQRAAAGIPNAAKHRAGRKAERQNRRKGRN